MALTTFDAIREDQYTAIVGITPTSMSGTRFVAAEEDADDFREWAEANPQAALRRFTINELGEEIDGPILDAARVFVTAEIVVAYPIAGKYGTPKRRMREKVMREDHAAIEAAAGVLGYGNIGPDCTVVGPPPPVQMETVGPVAFLTYTYRVAFTRDTGL